MNSQSLFLLFISFFLSEVSYSQANIIQLTNPSFEGFPRQGRLPSGWKDCGFPNESAPDTHPSGSFDVVKQPNEGNTYLGMVTRDNDTWERVTQQLISPIMGHQCYSFSIDLCRSELYVSQSRVTNAPANYVQPIKLIIWGGDNYCQKKERLAESPLITNTNWQTYDFKFEPKENHSFIVFEAYYKTPVLVPYNGNILLDKATEIAPIPCDEDAVIVRAPTVKFTAPNESSIRIIQPIFDIKAKVENIQKKEDIDLQINGKSRDNFKFNNKTGEVSLFVEDLRKGRNTISIQTSNSAGQSRARSVLIYEPEQIVSREIAKETEVKEQPATPSEAKVVTTPPKKDLKIGGYTKSQLKEGQVIKLASVSFKRDQANLSENARTYLDEIYSFLKENQEVVIEIGGHTSGLCETSFCDELSTKRAKSVADYLSHKGIPNKQLSYKGYGKTKPIASNNTPGGRRKNQRVEIKILSTDG
jgi:outer membrane protein OmpA-like peptidoglycan-associated protein